jgi:TPR repeat protein
MHFFNRTFASKLLVATVLAVGMAAVSNPQTLAANNSNAKEATDPAYKNAVALYNKASYSEALVEFEKLTNSKDVGELAKYYRALCLQNQNQIKAATDQYMFLYKNAQDKEVRYKAWQALKSLTPVATAKKPLQAKVSTSAKSAPKEGPGADAWLTSPQQDYGRSGPAATSEVSVTIIPTSCGRRRR